MVKRGWIRIVEAFAVLLILTIAFLIVFKQDFVSSSKTDDKIYSLEDSILESIELNNSLRMKILKVELSEKTKPSIGSDDNDFPKEVIDYINNSIGTKLICKVKICIVNDVCGIDYPKETQGKEIYARRRLISAEKTIYDPKQLKIACWKK